VDLDAWSKSEGIPVKKIILLLTVTTILGGSVFFLLKNQGSFSKPKTIRVGIYLESNEPEEILEARTLQKLIALIFAENYELETYFEIPSKIDSDFEESKTHAMFIMPSRNQKSTIIISSGRHLNNVLLPCSLIPGLAAIWPVRTFLIELLRGIRFLLH
jgi:hypothetical protein